MSNKLLVSLSTLLGLTSVNYLAAIAPIQAEITNGDFETGNLTGWERIETFINEPTVALGELTNVQTASYGTAPQSGIYQGLIQFSSNNSAFSDELDQFLNLTTGTFDGLGVTGGSAIKQQITVTAPSILSFSYNFLTNEPDTGFNDDFGFLTLNLNDTVEQIVSVTDDNFIPSGTADFEKETGYQEYSSVTLEVGTYTLGLGVANFNDFEGASGILIDNVTLTPVNSSTTIPEPSTAFPSLFVLIGGAFARKKKSDNQEKQ